MDEEGKCVVSVFEEAMHAGWISATDVQVIRKEVQEKAGSSEYATWLRQQIMQVLIRQSPDEKSKCLVAWAGKALPLLDTGRSTRVYFNPGDACHEALFTCLKAARLRLDICVFTITDDWITYEIRLAASRGVSIRIITDNEKAWDPGSDIYALADSGMQVRQDTGREHMHHKFAVIDDAQVITGSFNWTKGSCRNHENMIISDDLAVVAAYRQEFDYLWDEMQIV